MYIYVCVCICYFRSVTMKSTLKAEDFPVICPKNSSLPSQDIKRTTKVNFMIL